MASDIPKGFALFKLTMGFLETNGPLYGKWDGERLVMAFRVEQRHCNPAGLCHGGMLATFADMFLPFAVRFQAKLEVGMLPTINLACDFVAPAAIGAWVEGRADPVKITKNMIFAQGLATVDGAPVMRANGIFKMSPSGTAQTGVFPPQAMFDFGEQGQT